MDRHLSLLFAENPPKGHCEERFSRRGNLELLLP
jgi:hypothetical protein